MFEPFDWNGNGVHDFFDDFMTFKLVNGDFDDEREDDGFEGDEEEDD